MPTVITVGLTVIAVGLAAPASALAAGWTRPQLVEPGSHPILTFSPSGAAALGAQLTSHGRPSGADIDLAPSGTTFAASPYTLTAPSAGHGAEPLAGLALSSAGYLAASFAEPATPAPVLVRVAPPAPSNFTSLQPLIPIGAAASGQGAADTASLVATTAGELVGAGADDAGRLSTATLSPRATRMHTQAAPRGLAASDAYALATDAAGNAFLAGDGADGCTAVAFRAPRGRFRTTYRTRGCDSATPNVFDAIAATSRGYAGLLTEAISEAGVAPNRLYVQTGRDGHFGRAVRLGRFLGGPVGLAADADGELTAEWTDCQAGTLSNGQLSTTDCDIAATTGSVTRGFRARARSSAPVATGTTLARARSGTTLSALTADRGVAVSRCVAHRGCSFTATTARPGGGFRSAHRLGRGTTLISLSGDDHGDLLAVWTDGHDHLYAATASAATGRWSADHALSAGAVNPADVSAAYGPRGRAVVAWSVANRTYAASYGA
jgi:hypothetical protein